MIRFPITGLAIALLTGGAIGQPATDRPLPVQYTVRTPQGDRSGRERDRVLATVPMTADEVRAWAEDPKADKENRSATLYQDGYVEAIDRGPDGQVRYAIRDAAGIRACRDRASVLKTRAMTADQVKAWAQAPEGKAEGREVLPLPALAARETITGEKGSVSSRDGVGAAEVLKQSPDKIREWAADPKAEKAGRQATLFQAGHLEIIWRGPAGELLYSVRTERGTRTGRTRESVVKTLELTDEQVRAWAEDEAAAKEGRSATLFRDGFAEVISRGPAVEPPDLGP